MPRELEVSRVLNGPVICDFRRPVPSVSRIKSLPSLTFASPAMTMMLSCGAISHISEKARRKSSNSSW
eukprot:12758704-Ditylum_brightwellii.AAC.1